MRRTRSLDHVLACCRLDQASNRQREAQRHGHHRTRAISQGAKPIVTYRAGQRSTKLVSLETVLMQTKGRDAPERLKRWLYSAWKEDHLRYVLLVGDADLVPVRYMVLDRVTPAAFDYAFYPSDLYYADVARRDGGFDDWNARKDGFHSTYFGEVRGEKNKSGPINFDQIDYRPELAVGRWPVDSEDEVRMVTEKTIAYERSSRPTRRASAGRHSSGCLDGLTLVPRWRTGPPHSRQAGPRRSWMEAIPRRSWPTNTMLSRS